MHEINAIRYRRLMRRAVFLSFASVICAGLSVVLQVPDFYWAGLAFIVAAVSNGLAAGNARRLSLRQRAAAVRALQP